MTTHTTKSPGFCARLSRSIRRVCVFVLVIVAVAIAAKYYGFNRLDEEIRVRFETRLRANYPGLAVTVDSARRIEGLGIELRGISILEPGDTAASLIHIDEILAECDTYLPDFVTRDPVIRHLRIHRMKLYARRTPGGAWNLAQLLPLPTLRGSAMPPATVADSSIEVSDPAQNPTSGWTLRNIALTVQPQLVPVQSRASNVSGNPPDIDSQQPTRSLLRVQGTLAGDYLEKVEIDGILDPRGGEWDLRGAVEGLEFSPRLRSALPRELGSLLTPLASVRGRTFFGFQATRGAIEQRTKQAPPVRFTINGKIAEGRIDDSRLPDPLTDVEATIYADNLGIRIGELSARCGATHLELNGELDGYSPTSPCRLELHATQLDLGRLPLKSLPAPVHAVWKQYSPRGTIDLDAKLAYDGCVWHPDLTIACRDVSVQYDRFPYRVTDGTGTIELKQNTLTTRLRTIGGGTVIHVRSEIHQPGPNFTGWVNLESHGALPIDEKLIAALDSKSQRLVRLFQPRGGVSFQARFQREGGDGQVHRTLALDLHECSIEYEKFRYPIDKLSGTLQLTDDDWVFKKLEGRNDSGYILGSGTWLADAPDGDQLKLTITATDVPLEDELRRALSSPLQRLWGNLRPRGNIDHLKVQLKYNANEERLSLDVEAQKWPPGQNVEGRSISIEPAWFRYRLDNLTGRLHYRDGAITLTKLQAEHGPITVETDGECALLADGSSRVQLNRLIVSRLHLDNELLAALPESLGTPLAHLNLAGPVGMTGALGFVVPSQSELPPAVDWDLVFDLENGRIDAALPIEHIHGGLRLWGNAGANGFLARGDLKVDSAIIHDVQLTQVQGPIWIEPERLLIGAWAESDVNNRPRRSLTANAFGGGATFDAQLDLGGEGRFQLQSSLENADLAAIAAELAPRQKGLIGKVNGLVNLSGTKHGKHTWRGDGQIRLYDADIYELPVMMNMLKLLSVRDPNRTAFTKSNIDFRVQGDDLELKRIDFSGDAISLKGRGRLTATREIDLKFYPQLGRDDAVIPLFRPINAEAGRQFLLVEVTGTLDRPQVTKQAFPRIDAGLQQIFPELGEEREETLPPPLLRRPREVLERSGLFPGKR